MTVVSLSDFLTNVENTLNNLKSIDLNSPLAQRLEDVAKKCESLVIGWEEFGCTIIETQDQNSKDDKYESLQRKLKDNKKMMINTPSPLSKMSLNMRFSKTPLLFSTQEENERQQPQINSKKRGDRSDLTLGQSDDNDGELDLQLTSDNKGGPDAALGKKTKAGSNKQHKTKLKASAKKKLMINADDDKIDLSSYFNRPKKLAQEITPHQKENPAGKLTPLRKNNDSSEIEKILKPEVQQKKGK